MESGQEIKNIFGNQKIKNHKMLKFTIYLSLQNPDPGTISGDVCKIPPCYKIPPLVFDDFAKCCVFVNNFAPQARNFLGNVVFS